MLEPVPVTVGSMSGTSKCMRGLFSLAPVNSTVTFLGCTLTLAAPDALVKTLDVITMSVVAMEEGTPKAFSGDNVIIEPSAIVVAAVPVVITNLAVAPTSGGVITMLVVPEALMVSTAEGAANAFPPSLTPSNSGATLATVFWPANMLMLTITANTPITTIAITGRDSLKLNFFAI